MKSEVLKVVSTGVLVSILAACSSSPVAQNAATPPPVSEQRAPSQINGGGSGEIGSSDVSDYSAIRTGKIVSMKHQVPVGRITKVYNILSQKYPNPRMSVSLVVEDMGGSTDVSPTQKLFFTLYIKGEMFSTDLAFDLGAVLDIKGAKRVGPGKYQVDYSADFKNVKSIIIDASKAIEDILAVKCPSEFDCDASRLLKSSIVVSPK